MRDFLPAEKARRDAIEAVIRESFAAFGYREIETPVAEDLNRLIAGDSGENRKLIFKILRRGLAPSEPIDPATAADLGLRFDLTVPLSRFYATHRAELPDVFRAIQIAPAWRAERPQKGRYRQFTQCDIDVIGEASTLAEIELITATAATLQHLGIEPATVRINDRKVLTALLNAFGFAPGDHPAVLVAIDKLDKIGISGVAAELDKLAAPGGDRQGLMSSLDRLTDAESGPGKADAVLDRLPVEAANAAADLRVITAALAVASPGTQLVIDPTLVRGQGYYTGPIFEVVHPSFAGSIAGGGRYDGMIGRFIGTDVPACGFSIGFERIVELVDESRVVSGRQRVAVIYEQNADPGVVVAWQRRLIDGGADVRLARRIRNRGRLLGELAAEGCSAYLELGAQVGLPGAGEPALQSIRPDWPA